MRIGRLLEHIPTCVLTQFFFFFKIMFEANIFFSCHMNVNLVMTSFNQYCKINFFFVWNILIKLTIFSRLLKIFSLKNCFSR